ncbi:MAG: response regulator transcription factor [Leptolyngbyaceae cyanobacterium bins.302]|nr:response regulator transcription factor [Leptolyngbyaceae cyanobacterium bins.302]
MNILIVEDERNVASMVRSCIESEGYTCSVAYDGETGLQLFQQHQPDVVILDLKLPGMDGLDVCTHIRQSKAQKDPFILMLTARAAEIDRIIGYSTGADDYIPKPFSPKELVVRIRSLLRRKMRHQQDQPHNIETPHFLIDTERREVLVQKSLDGEIEEVSLTTVEFDLLVLMATRQGRVWTRTELLDTVRGIDYMGDDRAIDTYIKRLRDKISPAKQRERFIKTHIGIGYSFEDSKDAV